MSPELSLAEAAAYLGTPKDTLRKRIKRNPTSVRHRIDEMGRYWVTIDDATPTGSATTAAGRIAARVPDLHTRCAVAEAERDELRRNLARATAEIDRLHHLIEMLRGDVHTMMDAQHELLRQCATKEETTRSLVELLLRRGD